MNLEIGECCSDKSLDAVCGECRLDLMVYFLANKKQVTDYLRKHNFKLFKEIESARFTL